MDIEQILKEVTDYFKEKVIKGDYELLSSDEHVARVKIDGKYTVKLWIANIPKYNFHLYDLDYRTLKLDDFGEFRTQKERLDAFRILKPKVKEYEQKILKIQKQKEINRLKKRT